MQSVSPWYRVFNLWWDSLRKTVDKTMIIKKEAAARLEDKGWPHRLWETIEEGRKETVKE